MSESEPIEQKTSLDGLCDGISIYQYTKGHRFSTDDVLVAAIAATRIHNATKILELGSGIGTIGLVLSQVFRSANLTTIEAQEISYSLALRSIELNGLSNRFHPILSDFREVHSQLAENEFDLIIGSPPYFPLSSGVLPTHPQKRACRFEERGTVHDYCITASQYLGSTGIFVFVFPIDPEVQHQRVIQSISSSGLFLKEEIHVALKAGKKPLLGLFVLTKLTSSSTTKTSITIRDSQGQITAEYLALREKIGMR